MGKCQAVISLFCVDSLEIKVLDNLPEDYTMGQVVSDLMLFLLSKFALMSLLINR